MNASDRRLLIGLLCLAAALLFLGLDTSYLWQDEAETAVLARNVLHYGYPRAFDGTHLLHLPFATSRGYVWVFHQWMQFYLAAASFLLFGITTWAARVPFALLGVVAIGLTWVLAQRLFHDRAVTGLATVFLVTSAPFLLQMRQCRYYAPMAVFTLWSLLAYWRWLHGQRGAGFLWFAGMLLLFHTNWMASAALGAAVLGHWTLSGGHRSIASQAVARWSLAFAVLAIPWILYARAWEHGMGRSDLVHVWHNLQFYVRMVNSFIIPLGALGVLALWLVWRVRLRPRAEESQALSLIGWTVGMLGLALMLGRQHFFRYLVGIIPLLYLVAAWLLVKGCAARPRLLAVLALLMAFTDVLHRPDHLLQGSPRVYLADFFHQALGQEADSTKGIITFLNTHAREGESVKIRYSIAPLVFYTRLRVETEPYAFFQPTTPDWVVFQRGLIPRKYYDSQEYRTVLAQYEAIQTDIPDNYWGNAAEPYLALAPERLQVPRVTIYRKRSSRPIHAF